MRYSNSEMHLFLNDIAKECEALEFKRLREETPYMPHSEGGEHYEDYEQRLSLAAVEAAKVGTLGRSYEALTIRVTELNALRHFDNYATSRLLRGALEMWLEESAARLLEAEQT